MIKRLSISLMLSLLLLSNAACTIKEVKPWERGDLARQEMAFEPDATEAAFRDHVYFSKEASSGGADVGGGGCGCN